MKDYLIECNPTNGMNLEQERRYLVNLSKYGWDLVTILDITEIKFSGQTSHCFNYYFSRDVEINPKLRQAQLKEVPNNDKENSSC